mmetsp:Transcript_28369/g.62126  ORF Transcript_28369/g.62126 Transcript_28369/m.62126 type:complete len:211 (-) Transcript_28369:578-1210(-)|eukprot:CAMPEP_0118933210 /NCGR_PEP_ID=MMETSP1169-20130426/11639_1 /TAXON_ID=36882 /ORGANISM="Pyramimonas obovata, Strain CCMP722" /LENGTH=210 /DNA_ID=CAMNT_0006875943 /DNA_START=286 /DNA_END=918 /DNA_ORIENTATION=+
MAKPDLNSVRWVDSLLRQTYFHTCPHHPSMKKNECNNFCADCASEGLCQHCLHDHQGHRILQIRRYVYHDVVRIQDMDPLLSCEGIQLYHINNAAVAFLNQRPKLRPIQNPSQVCESCSRGLQDSNRFCSLACKVQALRRVKQGGSHLSPVSVNAVYELSDGPSTPESSRTLLKRKQMVTSSDDDSEDSHAAHQLRVRRRKPFPQRSPVC